MADKIILTDEQISWLCRHFRNTKNAKLAAKLGISESGLHRLARRYGLKKTPQFMRKTQAATTAAAKASHLKNGTYPPKGYIIPRSEEFRFGMPRAYKETPAKKRKRIEKAVQSRRETVREERIRIRWGFPQLTKMPLNPKPRAAAEIRYYLKTRGYHVERGSMVAYYDENTNRCPFIEKRRPGDHRYIGFTFVEVSNFFCSGSLEISK